MRCANCDTELREGAKFCHRCGTKAAVRCENCGHALEAEDLFCSECGARTGTELTEGKKTSLPAGQETKLPGVSPANRAKSWVNQCGDWVYILRNGVWKMRSDGSDLHCINRDFKKFDYYDDFLSLNVNKHGIFFKYSDPEGIVRLDLNGNFMGVNPLIQDKTMDIKEIFYIYDDVVYYTKHTSGKKAKTSIYRCRIDGSENRLLASFASGPEGSEEESRIRELCANGKHVAFWLWTDEEERKGWYLMNTDGTGCRKLQYTYRSENSETGTCELDIVYIDIDRELVYTSGTPSENEEAGLGDHWSRRSGIWERKLHEPLSRTAFKKPVWECKPDFFRSDDFPGWYAGHYYFDGKTCCGFTYGHKGINEGKKDYYYNLYALYPNGEAKFLNAGSRGGVDQLVVLGEYAYFDPEYCLRARLDGSGMIRMQEEFSAPD